MDNLPGAAGADLEDITDADLIAALDADAEATMRELQTAALSRARERGEFTANEYAVWRGLARVQIDSELERALADGKLTRRRGIDAGKRVWWYRRR